MPADAQPGDVPARTLNAPDYGPSFPGGRSKGAPDFVEKKRK